MARGRRPLRIVAAAAAGEKAGAAGAIEAPRRGETTAVTETEIPTAVVKTEITTAVIAAATATAGIATAVIETAVIETATAPATATATATGAGAYPVTESPSLIPPVSHLEWATYSYMRRAGVCAQSQGPGTGS